MKIKDSYSERKVYPSDGLTDLVDTLIMQAVAIKASDIHFEAACDCMYVRYRIDGVLYEQEPIAHAYQDRVIARLKVLSNLDTTERRIPQDGKFTARYQGNQIDFRISTFPGSFGEHIVLRILDRSSHMIDLERLGFSEEQLVLIKEMIQRSRGFLLVAGPTGSGKTTTLYAALRFMHDRSKHIITLEDPIEYHLEGITQGQVNGDIGFGFARGIRAILRQDPDVIMVGEMRDTETAKIAIQAALTGHNVLSTVHTTDSVSVIMRLLDMGVEAFLMSAAITGIIAQRLARMICVSCRYSYIPDGHEQEVLARYNNLCKMLYKGRGCSVCHQTGYKGRIGIFELLLFKDDIRATIIHNPSLDDLYNKAQKAGMKTLVQQGFEKVEQGQITLQELMRIL